MDITFFAICAFLLQSFPFILSSPGLSFMNFNPEKIFSVHCNSSFAPKEAKTILIVGIEKKNNGHGSKPASLATLSPIGLCNSF